LQLLDKRREAALLDLWVMDGFDPDELAGLAPRYLVPSFSGLLELDALSA
jgi:hypothetical protein